VSDKVVSDKVEPATKPVASHANWLHFLFSGVILLGSMAFYETTQAEALRHEVTQLQRDNSALRANLAKSDRASQQSLAAFHQELDRLRTELAGTRTAAGESLAMAQIAAVRHADALVGNLEKKRRQEEVRQRQLSAELTKVEQSAAETSMRLNGISSDVGSVKSEIESTRSAARDDLRQTRGDMGLMSGLIATNAEEIQMLRDLGGRNVYEFTLAKSSGMQRVGDIQVTLEKADAKHHLFSVQILAADQRVEKRDKSVNEPVQFYVPGKGGQPYELVVNQVDRNTVKGYLAEPILIARNDPSQVN
jgi:hypothetical protein